MMKEATNALRSSFLSSADAELIGVIREVQR